jgi:hypothetical protein
MTDALFVFPGFSSGVLHVALYLSLCYYAFVNVAPVFCTPILDATVIRNNYSLSSIDHELISGVAANNGEGR